MAVTVTYEYPVSGTTPPTQAQMAPTTQGGSNAVTAQVQFGADADTTAVITHNFNLATTGSNPSGTPNTSQLFPWVSFYVQNQGGAGTANPVLSCTIASNIITLTKTNTSNTSCTVNVAIFRPHSLMI